MLAADRIKWWGSCVISGALLAKLLALTAFSLDVSSPAALSTQAVRKLKVAHIERAGCRVLQVPQDYLKGEGCRPGSLLPGQLQPLLTTVSLERP